MKPTVRSSTWRRLTDMRLGEALALTWRDVNLDGSTVTVRASLRRADAGMTIGTPIDPIHLLRREFLPLLERAGVPRIRFHDLRHTAAILMRFAGVSVKMVSEVLGHADAAITLRIYSHVQPDIQASATAAMDQLLGSELGSSSHTG